MAQTIEIKTPGIIKIMNTSKVSKAFAPYRENFVTTLAAEKGIEFEVETAGQVLYYLGQATEGIVVEQLDAFSGDSAVTKLDTPATITLVNSSDREIGFVPYRENFTAYIKAGDTYTLEAKTVGQVLYYLAQATEGLKVTQAAKA